MLNAYNILLMNYAFQSISKKSIVKYLLGSLLKLANNDKNQFYSYYLVIDFKQLSSETIVRFDPHILRSSNRRALTNTFQFNLTHSSVEPFMNIKLWPQNTPC